MSWRKKRCCPPWVESCLGSNLQSGGHIWDWIPRANGRRDVVGFRENGWRGMALSYGRIRHGFKALWDGDHHPYFRNTIQCAKTLIRKSGAP